MKSKNTKKSGLSMGLTLILFALIPMIFSALILGIVLVKNSSGELKTSTSNSMVSLIKETGTSFDYSTSNNEAIMTAFTKAPIVKEVLLNPEDPELVASAQTYTEQFFGSLSGWEGIYIADWNSKVITHPAPPVVGKVMREGDKLVELQDAMLSAEGVYNVGIITSPASGQLIMSMYIPVYEGDTPIGYVGAGTFVNEVAGKFSDVSSLGLSSAYIYFVDATGTMLYHPDESKIGNPVENEAVKNLVAKLAKGEHPQPECVEYLYKGAMKYAAYYVGDKEAYIAVLTADEKDVLADINSVTKVTVILGIICVVIFGLISIWIAGIVSKPLKEVAKSTETLSTGDVRATCDTKSNIREIKSIIDAFKSLRQALDSSMTNVKSSANALNSVILDVDKMTGKNVDSVSQINDAINEVATTSQVVAESAQDMAEKASEIGINIEKLNDNASSLYEASLTIKNANTEASDCMKSVYDGAIESVNAMQSILDKISETNTAISEIGSAIQAIESIAAQTNLLSLNASIEAARAGEAGRGFAVVADEIRTLADSSAMSAREIKQIIENIISLSKGTVDISNRVYDVVIKEQEDIENTQKKFLVLSDSVEDSILGIDTIKKMAGNLDRIKEELASATADLGAVSEELGASAQEVAASCQAVATSCSDTQNSTEQMRSVNESMSSAIDFFTL